MHQLRKNAILFVKEAYLFQKSHPIFRLFLFAVGLDQEGEWIENHSMHNTIFLINILKALQKKSAAFKINELSLDHEKLAVNLSEFIEQLGFGDDASNILRKFSQEINKQTPLGKTNSDLVEICLELSMLLVKKQSVIINSYEPIFSIVSVKEHMTADFFQFML